MVLLVVALVEFGSLESRAGRSCWCGRRGDVRSLGVWYSKGGIRRVVGVVGDGWNGRKSWEEAVSLGRKLVVERSSVDEAMVRSNDKVEE